MQANHGYTIDVVWTVRERLEPYGIVSAPLHAPDGISFSRNGHEHHVPDLLAIAAGGDREAGHEIPGHHRKNPHRKTG